MEDSSCSHPHLRRPAANCVCVCVCVPVCVCVGKEGGEGGPPPKTHTSIHWADQCHVPDSGRLHKSVTASLASQVTLDKEELRLANNIQQRQYFLKIIVNGRFVLLVLIRISADLLPMCVCVCIGKGLSLIHI